MVSLGQKERSQAKSLSNDNSFYMRGSQSLAFLPSLNKQELVAQKQKKEFEMSRLMRKELDGMEIKKLTQ